MLLQPCWDCTVRFLCLPHALKRCGPATGKAPQCSRRQSFAAAAATLLVPTAATAATAEQVERAAKQGILKCFEKRDDKLVNVCKLAEIEERKANADAPPRQVSAEVPVDMDALRVARERRRRRSGPASSPRDAGVAERFEVGRGRRRGARAAARALWRRQTQSPAEEEGKERKELRAAAEEARARPRPRACPGWRSPMKHQGRVFYGNVKTGRDAVRAAS